MSFETCMSFLTQATETGAADAVESPSSRIVVGRAMAHGTGSCDVMVDYDAIDLDLE